MHDLLRAHDLARHGESIQDGVGRTLTINLGRLGEFRADLDASLDQKRAKVMDNWREVSSKQSDWAQRLASIQARSIEDLVDGEMFLRMSKAEHDEMAKALVIKGGNGGFRVVYQMFPDQPRDMNDNFVAHALRTLIEFESNGAEVTWLPSWLVSPSQPADVQGAIRRLINLGVSTFNADPQRKTVLQYSACARRIAKIMMALIPEIARLGHKRHQQIRHIVDEFSLAQILSSPEGHGLRSLNQFQTYATMRFVRSCMDDRGNFSTARAETALKDSWAAEKSLLQDGRDYWTALEGRGFGGEVNPTERSWVDYDSLGHIVLCLLKASDKWVDYVKTNHHTDLMRIAATGSWMARELIGQDNVTIVPSDEEQAFRYFGGDLRLFQDLRLSYSNRSR